MQLHYDKNRVKKRDFTIRKEYYSIRKEVKKS